MTDIVVKPIFDDEMAILRGWWSAVGFGQVTDEGFPKIRFMVFADNTPVCAAFMYHDTSAKFAWVAWHTMNPHNLLNRGESLDCLHKKFIEEAKSLGVMSLFTAVNNPSLLGRLVNDGWVMADMDCVHLVKNIGD